MPVRLSVIESTRTPPLLSRQMVIFAQGWSALIVTSCPGVWFSIEYPLSLEFSKADSMQITKQCRATFQDLMDHDCSPLNSTECSRSGHRGNRLLNKTVEQIGLRRNRPALNDDQVQRVSVGHCDLCRAVTSEVIPAADIAAKNLVLIRCRAGYSPLDPCSPLTRNHPLRKS